MAVPLSFAFWGLALTAVAGVPSYAWYARGRQYAAFAAVIVVLSMPGVAVMRGRLLQELPPSAHGWLSLVFAYGMAAATTHLASLVTPRLRSLPFRVAVSIPGMAFIAAGFLSGIWLLALMPARAALVLLGWPRTLDAMRWLDLVPFAITALSLVTSTRLVEEVVRVRLEKDGPHEVARLRAERYRRGRAQPLPERPLRIVQIADPHLGPWQPVHKLRRQIDRLLAHDPDLVLLTGDFLTMEGSGTPGALGQALAPLRRLDGRCFAIFGNHDHGARDEIRSALTANGVRLLVDEEVSCKTAVGPVQLVGADYVGRGRREHIQGLLEKFPRRAEQLRLFLLHDPLGFQHVPVGGVDLTLSGHTHGGQLGLVSFGLDWTVLTATAWPDHGLFGHGPNRLYVHRGTGFYGFPLRIGVPGEASVLELVLG